MGGSIGDRGCGPPPPQPLKNHKNIVFISNTGLDPLENQKATKSCSIQCRVIIGLPAKRLSGETMITHFWWYLDPLPLINLKKTTSDLDPLRQNFLDPGI